MTTDTITPPDTERARVREEVLAGGGITFTEAARLLPRLRAGRPVNQATVFRWAVEGIKIPGGQRLKLGAVRIGGHFATTRAALDRFISAQNPEPDDAAAPPPRSPGRRRRGSESADAELRRRGC